MGKPSAPEHTFNGSNRKSITATAMRMFADGLLADLRDYPDIAAESWASHVKDLIRTNVDLPLAEQLWSVGLVDAAISIQGTPLRPIVALFPNRNWSGVPRPNDSTAAAQGKTTPGVAGWAGVVSPARRAELLAMSPLGAEVLASERRTE